MLAMQVLILLVLPYIINKRGLYGKYISSGYHKKNSEIQQIIIPVQRISQKEENQLLKLDSVFTIKSTLQPYKKLIIINNENIINMFSNFTKSKSLKQFIIDSPANIFNTFLHSIMIECDEYKRIQIENIGLAHEIFIHAYSKNNKILKITEERTGSKKKKSKNKKKYYISFADKDDYDIIAGNLYTKVIQNRIGRNTIGIDINKNNIFDKKELICNSIIIQVPPLILN